MRHLWNESPWSLRLQTHEAKMLAISQKSHFRRKSGANWPYWLSGLNSSLTGIDLNNRTAYQYRSLKENYNFTILPKYNSTCSKNSKFESSNSKFENLHFRVGHTFNEYSFKSKQFPLQAKISKPSIKQL